MKSTDDPATPELLLTHQNRHQYLETAMVSESDSERLMTEAEARGRERRIREHKQQKKVQWMVRCIALASACIVLTLGLMWLAR